MHHYQNQKIFTKSSFESGAGLCSIKDSSYETVTSSARRNAEFYIGIVSISMFLPAGRGWNRRPLLGRSTIKRCLAKESQLKLSSHYKYREFCKVYWREQTSLAIKLIKTILAVLLTECEVYFSLGVLL